MFQNGTIEGYLTSFICLLFLLYPFFVIKGSYGFFKNINNKDIEQLSSYTFKPLILFIIGVIFWLVNG